jgi:ribosomal protein S18 acetylase RimI-like enzyme
VPAQPELVVRTARGSDVGAVVAIDAETGSRGMETYWRQRIDWSLADRPERCFLVAESAGVPVGFIIGEVRAWEFGSPPAGWIFAVGVRTSARQDGVGTVLFDEICARFRALGVQHVRTMLSKNDVLVMSFFRAQGMMAGPFIQLEMTLERP